MSAAVRALVREYQTMFTDDIGTFAGDKLENLVHQWRLSAFSAKERKQVILGRGSKSHHILLGQHSYKAMYDSWQ